MERSRLRTVRSSDRSSKINSRAASRRSHLARTTATLHDTSATVGGGTIAATGRAYVPSLRQPASRSDGLLTAGARQSGARCAGLFARTHRRRSHGRAAPGVADRRRWPSRAQLDAHSAFGRVQSERTETDIVGRAVCPSPSISTSTSVATCACRAGPSMSAPPETCTSGGPSRIRTLRVSSPPSAAER